MEHISFEAHEEQYRNTVWDFYFGDRSVGVLDIETTGLDRRHNHFVLGGLYDCGKGIFHQIFADNIAAEREALQAFMDLTDQFDVLVTFNGRHFDIPFMEERSRRAASGPGPGAEDPGTEGSGAEDRVRRSTVSAYDLDLYQVVNGHSPLRRLLPNLRQKTVESYMGLWQDRSDEIDGAKSVELYYYYARTGDREARRQILLHNSDDVLQLTRLVKVINKCDFHKAMYHMGFPVGPSCKRWQVRRAELKGNALMIEGTQGREPMDYRGYSMGQFPLHSVFDAGTGNFRMEVPILRQSGIAAADLKAAGLDEEEFKKYPDSGSGFLVLQQGNEVKYKEVNHLIKALIRRFTETL